MKTEATKQQPPESSTTEVRALVSVVILAKNEEDNLPDCLTSLEGLPAEIFLVDSGSTDRTLEIAQEAGCKVFEHPWENYAKQRNWAFENLPFTTDWILSLDADERLLPDIVEEIKGILTDPPRKIDGFLFRKRTYFMGRWIKHGGHYPSFHLRLARRGKVRCEERLYDQHFVVDGETRETKNDYQDILTNSITSWTDRHNHWATLEAREITIKEVNPGKIKGKFSGGTPIHRRRWLREDFYQKFPLFVRPVFYFTYRYFLRLGFLDGVEGLIFHFLQGFWFRFLVDAKIYEERKFSRQGNHN